jgi:uncharacterized protein (DUF2235 family)
MPGKRIVICADGAWSSPYRSDGSDPALTNVLRVSQGVKPIAHDGTPQLVYHHSGVGTGWPRLDRVIGGGMGIGLSKGIVDAYGFLVDNYEAGDPIFLFGFSRGAYTVRSLAGLIRNCGILRKEHADRITEAYARYRDRDAPEWHPNGLEAMAFRDRYSWREARRRSDDPRGEDTVLHFLGVWETVGALGVPAGLLRGLAKRRYAFHDTQLSRWVDHAYHALAIDERRAAFFPTLWDPGSPRLAGQSLLQVWFAGVHANVGGGYPDTGLSDLALEWLAHHAMAHGLDLDRASVRRSPNALGHLADSQTLGFRALGVWGKLNPVKRWCARTDLRAAEDVEIARRTSWTGDCLRPIPPGTTIHPSVDRRRLGHPEYRPANVAMAPSRRVSGAAGTSAA